MMDYDDYDEDLPWDGLWEYVLGDEIEDEPRWYRPSFRRQRSDDSPPPYEYAAQYLTSEETSRKEACIKKKSDTQEKSDSKKSLSLPRQSSFSRQSSNKSTSTNGSNSSSRLRSMLRLGKKEKEVEKKADEVTVFESLLTPAAEEDVKESRDDPGAPGVFARMSSSYDDAGREEYQVKQKKEKKKSFWKKKENKTSKSGDFSFNINPSLGIGTENNSSTKKGKRTKKEEKASESGEFFGFGMDNTASTKREKSKKKEDKAAESVEFFGFGTEKASSTKREKRMAFWKRKEKQSTTSESPWSAYGLYPEIDEDSSEPESIDGLLGPWEGGTNETKAQTSANTTTKATKSDAAKSFKTSNNKSTNTMIRSAGILMAVSRFKQSKKGGSKQSGQVSTLERRRSLTKPFGRNKKKPSVAEDDDSDDDPDNSFLPQSLLLWQSDDDSTKSPSKSSSSFSEDSEQEEIPKKSVSWADDVQSEDLESDVDLGVSFSDIREWLYSTVSSSEEESDSTTTSGHQSSESEDISSVPTADSDISTTGVSSRDDSDKEDVSDVQQQKLSSKVQDKSKQLPSINEDESYRSARIKKAETDDTAAKKPTVPERKINSAPDALLSDHGNTTNNITRIQPEVEEGSVSAEKSALILTSISAAHAMDTDTAQATEKKMTTTGQVEEISSTGRGKGKQVQRKIKASQEKKSEPRILLCKALRSLSDEDIVRAMESGIPVHELSYEELAEIFPKIRMVADEQMSDQASLVLGNTNSFDDSRPALLQVPSKAIKPALGLSSLYEYDFTSGQHKKVLYKACGADPKSSLEVKTFDSPPENTEAKFSIVQVEASTISNTDCRTRRDGWFGNKRVELPNTPGVDIVGKIYRIDYESSRQTGLKKGDRVISLVSQGGNSRYIEVDPSSLVKISEQVDPAEAACLVETYLTVFQTLHHNQSFLTRYRKGSLHGKTILVIGGLSINMARAVSQLAHHAGSKSIFATSRKRDFKHLSQNGILPLPTDPVEWWEQLAGAVDILISLDEEVIPLHHKLLKLDGTIVVSSTEFHEDLMMSVGSREPRRRIICSTSKSRLVSTTSHYDLYEEWNTNPTRVRKDLSYLIELLEKRKIVPNVVDRVPLEKVAEIQELLEKRRAKGHYVCEPWLVSKSRAVSL